MGGRGRGERVGMRMRESEGTQADPLVSEICLLMFGLGKWKLLWRVRRINPSFLISRWRCGGREKKKGDRCVYTGGKGGDEGGDTRGPRPDTRKKRKISTRNAEMRYLHSFRHR